MNLELEYLKFKLKKEHVTDIVYYINLTKYYYGLAKMFSRIYKGNLKSNIIQETKNFDIFTYILKYSRVDFQILFAFVKHKYCNRNTIPKK